MKPTALIFCPFTLGFGTPQVLDLAESLRHNNFSVLLYEHQNQTPPSSRPQDIKKIPHFSFFPPFVNSFLWLFYLSFIVLFYNVNILIFTQWTPLVLLKFLKPKLITTYYALELPGDFSQPKNVISHLFHPLNQLAKNKLDSIIAPQSDRLQLVAQSFPHTQHNFLVLNAPPLKKNLKITPKTLTQKPLIYYQGQLSSWTHNKLLLNLIKKHHSRYNFLIIGPCQDEDTLKKLKQLQTQQYLTYLPQVPHSELKKYQRRASVGLILWKQFNLSTRYASPNKLFEYISQGLPVISTSLFSLHQWNKQYNFGIVLKKNSLAQLDQSLKKITQLKSFKHISRSNINHYQTELNYNHQITPYIKYLQSSL